MRVAILTVSDRAAGGEYQDKSGPAVAECLKANVDDLAPIAYDTVPDDRGSIAARISQWCDSGEVDVIVTTGGTGLTARDVTPEATCDVIEREIPGLAEAMRAAGRASIATADLSRQVVGQRGRTLVVNLPGSPKGAVESLSAIVGAFAHATELMKQ